MPYQLLLLMHLSGMIFCSFPQNFLLWLPCSRSVIFKLLHFFSLNTHLIVQSPTMDSQNTHLHFSTASCWVQSRFLSAEGFQPGRFCGFSSSGYRWEVLIHEQASSKVAKQPPAITLRLSNELSDVSLEFPVKGIFQNVSAVLNCCCEQTVAFLTAPNFPSVPLLCCCSTWETSFCCWFLNVDAFV